MANLIVNGGKKMSGTIVPSGNKNAILPILCASLLTSETVVLSNVPDVIDVNKLLETMKLLGANIKWDKNRSVLEIKNDEISLDSFENDFPIGMRGSLLLLAPLVSRLKEITLMSKVGGCALGIREIDPHLDALRRLGAKVDKPNSGLRVSINDRFIGAEHWMYYTSVTTTENFIMAAVGAKGKSMLMNAASEPHVQDLCNFLNSIGAKINGVGSNCLVINGVDSLGGVEHEVISDHHEITTFLALGAMTGGGVKVKKAIPQHFQLIVKSFRKLGVEITYEDDTAIVDESQKMIIADPFTMNAVQKIEAAPWPYFPVDLLPLMMALATRSKGQIMFWNKVYEGANFWVTELNKFGAKFLICDPHRIVIWGGRLLMPAEVNAPEIIRATVALFMIAQSIEGKSVIKNADVIKRAHPSFVEKMVKLGADVEWED